MKQPQDTKAFDHLFSSLEHVVKSLSKADAVLGIDAYHKLPLVRTLWSYANLKTNITASRREKACPTAAENTMYILYAWATECLVCAQTFRRVRHWQRAADIGESFVPSFLSRVISQHIALLY